MMKRVRSRKESRIRALTYPIRIDITADRVLVFEWRGRELCSRTNFSLTETS